MEKDGARTKEKQSLQLLLRLLPARMLASLLFLVVLLRWCLSVTFLLLLVLPPLLNLLLVWPLSVFSLPLRAFSFLSQQKALPPSLIVRVFPLVCSSSAFALMLFTCSLTHLALLTLSIRSALLLWLPVSPRVTLFRPFHPPPRPNPRAQTRNPTLQSCLSSQPHCDALPHRLHHCLAHILDPFPLYFLRLLYRIVRMFIGRCAPLSPPQKEFLSQPRCVRYNLSLLMVSSWSLPLLLVHRLALRVSSATALPVKRCLAPALLRRGMPLLILAVFGYNSPSAASAPAGCSSLRWLAVFSIVPSFPRIHLQSAEASILLPSNASWACRISESRQRCGEAGANAATGQTGGICRLFDCCAKQADHLLGNICTPDPIACRSHKPEYSYGRCSPEHYCHNCGKHAQCNYDNTTNGGVWCQCHPPRVGDGITCEDDPCASASCVGGICIPFTTDSRGYTCKCLPGFVSVVDQQGQVVRCLDPCKSGFCGRGALACYTGQRSHICACGVGYINVERNGNEECVQPDLCQVNPCGPPSAVRSCRTISSSSYTCTCAADFTLARVNGKQYCIRKH